MKSLLIVRKPPKHPTERTLVWDEVSLEARKLFPEGVAPARDPSDEDAADEAAIAWTKDFGRKPLEDGRSLREILVYGGMNLWWAAEIYLHYQTSATHYVRLIETFFRILERERPEEVTASGLGPTETLLLGRVATALEILFDGPRAISSFPISVRTLGFSLESRLNSVKTFASAFKTLLAGRNPKATEGAIVVLSHAAFWREGPDGTPYEHYFDRILPALAKDLPLFVLGVGPSQAFRKRGTLARLKDWARLSSSRLPFVPINRFTSLSLAREVLSATRHIRSEWERLRQLPALLEAFSYRGVNFSDLTGPDFAATMLLQLPWAFRSYLEMGRVLDVNRSKALLLYAESSGWGRVALEAARAGGVPSVAMQHGILYPKYFSYRHDKDEGDCPRPIRTALFGEAAKEFLVEKGRYDPLSLVLTGSPKFDALVEASKTWDRNALRARCGVSEGETLILVASRYRGILPTHRAIGSAFVPFLRAAMAQDGVRVLVKPHPAEGRDGYETAIRETGATRVRVVRGTESLVELLFACDVLVTVESLSAIEALVLDRRVLVLNMPSNLRELVDAGVALGVSSSEDPAHALERILQDPPTLLRLKNARASYLSKVAMGVDGRATERIVALIRAAIPT